MPITPAFTAAQSGLTPSVVTLTDTSTGSDVLITQRRVYFQTNQGAYLVPSGTLTDYATWAYADTSESFDILTVDYALSVTVQWLDSSDTVLYTLTQLYCFPQNLKNFFYYLFQQQALSPIVPLDTNYYLNISTLWSNIIGAIQSVEVGADIASSQNCLNRATYMMQNESEFF